MGGGEGQNQNHKTGKMWDVKLSPNVGEMEGFFNYFN